MSASPTPRPARVAPTPLAKVVAQLPEQVSLAPGATATRAVVTGVAQASDAVHPGDLYVALPGTRTHGAAFVDDAARRGAVAVLTDPVGAQRLAQLEGAGADLPVLMVPDPRQVVGLVAAAIFGQPSTKLRVVGITGTNGKTTTAHLADAMLRRLGCVTALLGTVHSRIGDRLLPSARTTPEAADVQALLAVAVERGADTVVMETSSHALALGRVEGVHFTAGAFTNLSIDHLDFHVDLADYFAAKARLFDGRCDHEIVVIDDDAGRRLVKPTTTTVSTTVNPSASWSAGEIRICGYGQQFTLRAPDGRHHCAKIDLPGMFNVSNGLLAIAILVTIGADISDAVAALERAPGAPGRMERIGPADLPITAVVDYAHTPDGVIKALEALRGITRGRLICVLGCGGDRDTGKRPLMGAAAASGADLFIATDDNPRSEAPEKIRAAMLAGVSDGPGAGQVVEIGARAEAIDYAVRAATAGDTVALLGKGHEQGQEIAGVKNPFDDREVLAGVLAQVYG